MGGVGGAAQPAQGLGVVPRHPLADAVEEREVDLCRDVALAGRLSQPPGALGRVLVHAPAVQVERREARLRAGVPLLGRPLVPAGGLGVVPRDVLAVLVEQGHRVLGPDLPLVGGETHQPRRLGRVELHPPGLLRRGIPARTVRRRCPCSAAMRYQRVASPSSWETASPLR